MIETIVPKLSKFCRLHLITLMLVAAASAQNAGLPHFRKGESYAKVRVKMIKAGWKPFHAEDSDECFNGDSRCAGRPEMNHCAGTGLGNCEFLWKRKGKTAAIYTVGEEGGSYSGYEFLK